MVVVEWSGRVEAAVVGGGPRWAEAGTWVYCGGYVNGDGYIVDGYG